MKRDISIDTVSSLPCTRLTMFLHPIIYAGSEFLKESVQATSEDSLDCHGKYQAGANPERIINGPLSDYGEELEQPISESWQRFVEDCKWLVKELGFSIIHFETINKSNKSEYVIQYGIDDTPCGKLVYEIMISDQPFDVTFPEQFKDTALKYLNMESVIDGTATKEGIDFQVEKVTVGTVMYETWDCAFDRLYNLLKKK